MFVIYVFKKKMWHPCKEFSLYEVTRDGRLRHCNTLRVAKPKPRQDGYIRVTLYTVDKKKITVGLHRVIASTFLSNPDNHPVVDHINGIKHDNRVENLRWASLSTNAKNVKPKKFGLSRPVLQLTSAGILVERHDSNKSAATKYGIQASSIYLCCNGKITNAGGFVWKYADINEYEDEIWKELTLDERCIRVSNLGRIKFENNRITEGFVDSGAGYRRISITHGGQEHTYRLHRLVLMAHDNITEPDKYVVNHKDKNKLNNRVDNLEWCLQSDNIKHARGLEYNTLQKEIANC